LIRKSILMKYARSLAEVAMETGTITELVAGYQELLAATTQAPDLTVVLKSPALPLPVKSSLLGELGRRLGWHRYFVDFLRLLVENHRVAYFAEIQELFETELERLRGVVKAVAYTAQPMPDARRQELAVALRAALGREVQLEAQVNPQLIGGLMVRVADTVYDGSVRCQLDRIWTRLTAVP
jgi:F-type H+-transporting ATPase subunit delta